MIAYVALEGFQLGPLRIGQLLEGVAGVVSLIARTGSESRRRRLHWLACRVVALSTTLLWAYRLGAWRRLRAHLRLWGLRVDHGQCGSVGAVERTCQRHDVATRDDERHIRVGNGVPWLTDLVAHLVSCETSVVELSLHDLLGHTFVLGLQTEELEGQIGPHAQPTYGQHVVSVDAPPS